MAFNKAPSDWLDNISEDGTDLTVPIATFPELTADEADAANGDIRKVSFAILEKLYQEYNGRAVADRPTRMIVSRGTSVNDQTGQMTRTYSVTFIMETTPGAIEVVAEPT